MSLVTKIVWNEEKGRLVAYECSYDCVRLVTTGSHVFNFMHKRPITAFETYGKKTYLDVLNDESVAHVVTTKLLGIGL